MEVEVLYQLEGVKEMSSVAMIVTTTDFSVFIVILLIPNCPFHSW